MALGFARRQCGMPRSQLRRLGWAKTCGVAIALWLLRCVSCIASGQKAFLEPQG